MNDLLLKDVISAYAMGYFPMAESREQADFYWYDPPLRGQLDIAALHIPAKLRKTVLKAPYRITVNQAFAAVIEGCAAPQGDEGPQSFTAEISADTNADTPADTRADTWINPAIRDIFVALHHAGFTHSVEAWQGDRLVGGLYGLALGGVFCGESMFSRARDASKICLVHLCARLWRGGFKVLDTQYVNDHLKQFGCYEIEAEAYRERLREALPLRCDFMLRQHAPLQEAALVRDYLENRQYL